jgi:hypothetical protein
MAGPAPATAQQPVPSQSPSFSQVTFYAGGSAQIGANRFSTFYRASPGLEIEAVTPFYAGVAGGGLGLRRYEGRAGRASEDLWAFPAALRWGLRLPLPGVQRLRAEASVRLGALFMRFSAGSAGLRNESELLAGADAGLSLRLGNRWQIVAGGRYEHVFTAPSIRLWQGRIGVRRTFDAPDWLRMLLR